MYIYVYACVYIHITCIDRSLSGIRTHAGVLDTDGRSRVNLTLLRKGAARCVKSGVNASVMDVC